jgi:2'-hydroxyisoflavone reductase
MPSSLTRRSFLASSTAAAAGVAWLPRVPARKKTILMLGGTGFLGPAVVDSAIARGHEVTLFNRGKTDPGRYPKLEQLRGQRRRPHPDDAKAPPQDLKALEGRKWDAVVDTSGYFTGEVEDVCKVLAANAGQYVYISSLSVYKSLEVDATPIDEQSALAELADKYVWSMHKERGDYANYGGLKRHCEDAVAAAFPGKATLVRPGYIVGPGDPTDRFTSWPARLLRGGECLAPGDPDNDLQFIDVRDLGAWIVTAIEQGHVGPFNAVGFDAPITVQEFLHTGKGTLNHKCSFTWVDDAFLEQHKATPWVDIGCWTPKAKNGHTDNKKLIAAGATFRPIADTIRDTAAWLTAKDGRGDREWKVGLTPEREARLLALWKEQQGAKK